MRTIQRDIVGAFIFSRDDKILLGQSTAGGVYTDHWIVPGGGIEQTESHEAALLREVFEETGLDVSDDPRSRLGRFHSGQSEKVLKDSGERVLVAMKFYDFEVRLSKTSEEVELHGLDDFCNAEWFDKRQADSLQLGPATRATLCALGFLKTQ